MFCSRSTGNVEAGVGRANRTISKKIGTVKYIFISFKEKYIVGTFQENNREVI